MPECSVEVRRNGRDCEWVEVRFINRESERLCRFMVNADHYNESVKYAIELLTTGEPVTSLGDRSDDLLWKTEFANVDPNKMWDIYRVIDEGVVTGVTKWVPTTVLVCDECTSEKDPVEFTTEDEFLAHVIICHQTRAPPPQLPKERTTGYGWCNVL